MAQRADRPARARADYGVDAPGWLLALLGATAVCLVGTVVALVLGAGWWALFPALLALEFAGSSGSFLYTTRVGKFRVWRDLLAGLALRGDETVVDMGCGRGLVLLMVARLLPSGRALGVDLWKTADQSGNSEEVTRRNAELEGLSHRVELRTGDMTAMPFPDASADLVVSSLAIHNLPARAGRAAAIDEAVRVLKPGGRLAIADIGDVSGEYAARLRQRGMDGVQVRGLGWRFWYGGPWVATRLVTARRPSGVPAKSEISWGGSA
jgi:arsenite methyltransferase